MYLNKENKVRVLFPHVSLFIQQIAKNKTLHTSTENKLFSQVSDWGSHTFHLCFQMQGFTKETLFGPDGLLEGSLRELRSFSSQKSCFRLFKCQKSHCPLFHADQITHLQIWLLSLSTERADSTNRQQCALPHPGFLPPTAFPARKQEY